MKLTARGAMSTRQNSRRLSGFGNMWKSGEQGVVYYPVTQLEDKSLDVLVGMCWGHNANPKELGLKRIFIPTLSEIMDGVPKQPDLTYQFSKIAPLFIAGAKEKKMAELEKKTMSETQRKAAMKKVDEEFEKLEPVIGKLRLVISTECVYVPLDAKGEPDIEKARLVSQDLSDTRINAILAILANKQYEVEPDAKWLEVQYNFGTKGDRKEDGKVSPVGVTKDFSIQKRFPDVWPRLEQLLGTLPDNEETIMKRNSSFHACEESAIYQSLNAYAVYSSDALDSITTEEDVERMVKNAGIINHLQIPIENLKLREKLATSIISEDASIKDGAPTLADLQKDTLRENARDEAVDNDDLASTEERVLGDLSNLTQN